MLLVKESATQHSTPSLSTYILLIHSYDIFLNSGESYVNIYYYFFMVEIGVTMLYQRSPISSSLASYESPQTPQKEIFLYIVVAEVLYE